MAPGAQILVVDDHHGFRAFAGAMLERDGFTVAEAAIGGACRRARGEAASRTTAAWRCAAVAAVVVLASPLLGVQPWSRTPGGRRRISVVVGQSLAGASGCGAA
jgi:CheY-like chemotaxis protein